MSAVQQILRGQVSKKTRSVAAGSQPPALDTGLKLHSPVEGLPSQPLSCTCGLGGETLPFRHHAGQLPGPQNLWGQHECTVASFCLQLRVLSRGAELTPSRRSLGVWTLSPPGVLPTFPADCRYPSSSLSCCHDPSRCHLSFSVLVLHHDAL